MTTDHTMGASCKHGPITFNSVGQAGWLTRAEESRVRRWVREAHAMPGGANVRNCARVARRVCNWRSQRHSVIVIMLSYRHAREVRKAAA